MPRQDVEVLELIRDGGVWTLGRQTQEVAVADWMDFLEKDQYKAAGEVPDNRTPSSAACNWKTSPSSVAQ